MPRKRVISQGKVSLKGENHCSFPSRGRIQYAEMYEMLKNMDPPLGFGSKCPDRLAYKKLIRMNMPLDNEGKVHFTTTLFALIRENLSIKMRSAEEMDQADVELRETILKVWPFTARDKIELLVPTTKGTSSKELWRTPVSDPCALL